MTKHRPLKLTDYDKPGVRLHGWQAQIVEFLDEPGVFYLTTGRQLTREEAGRLGAITTDTGTDNG